MLRIIFHIVFLHSFLISQEFFFIDEKISASFKMGSMSSNTKTYISDFEEYTRTNLSFKGKGIARLMSRDMVNGTIVSFKDSTLININHKKRKFSKKTFTEIIEDRVEEINKSESNNKDNQNTDFFISDSLYNVNNYLCEKLVINNPDQTIEVWFTKNLIKPDYVKNINEQVSNIGLGWRNVSINFEKYDIDNEVIMVKLINRSKDGDFIYELISYEQVDEIPNSHFLPKEYKKVDRITF